MGACGAKSVQTYQDLESLPMETVGKLGFNVRISDLKMKMEDLSRAKVIMRIADLQTYETEWANEVYGRIYFKAQHQSMIQITEEHLRRTYLVIDIFNTEVNIMASISINMYLVATGPQHFDYEFLANLGKVKRRGKISFDLKIAQIVQVHIDPKFLEFNLTQPFIHDSYYYSLKLVTSSISFQSEYSTVIKNKGLSIKQQEHRLTWIDDDIELNVEVPLIEIALSSIQFCLWAKQDNEQVLICETYANLNQMFLQAMKEQSIMEDQQKIYKFLSKQNNKRLWNHGQDEGVFNCGLELRIPSYLKQQLVGVRTEKGIQQGSSVVKEGQTVVKEVQDLLSNSLQLFNNCVSLQSPKIDIKTKVNIISEQQALIRKMISILNSTQKVSITSFVYKSQQELFESQKIFIDIAYTLIDIADQQDDTIKEDFYQMVKLTINRGELNLNQMGFSIETEQTSQKLMKLKTEVAINYQRFLYKGLQIILQKLKQKSLGENERNFVESFFASAYFKIPEFQDRIIVSIQKPEDQTLPEWRSLTANNFYENKELVDLFDWHRHFYKYIQNEAKYEHNQQTLMTILNEQGWQKRMGKRGLAFFFFLKEWCDHISLNVVVKGGVIPWQSLSGYSILIKGFLLEMKSREIKAYPEAMKQALLGLLQNNQLLNIVIVILFKKTNVYDSETLLATLEILNMCLQYLFIHKIPLPTSLDQQFFLKGIKSILSQCEHAFCIAKCIWLLYNNYLLLPLDIKKDIIDYIFDNVAVKFFIHWSYNVRMIFHHFLIYRVFHLHRSNKSINEEAIEEQYQKQMQPRKQHSFLVQKGTSKAIISDMIFMRYHRFGQVIDEGRHLATQQQKDQVMEEINFHKQMRMKLMKANMLKRKGSSLSVSSMSSQYFIIEDEDPGVIKAISHQQSQQPSIREPSVFDELAITKAKSHQLQSRENIELETKRFQKYKLEPQQMKYMLKATIEYDEIRIKYQKWKSSKMNVNTYTQLNDEQKETFIESFEVPDVKLVIPIDEKEGTVGKSDEW